MEIKKKIIILLFPLLLILLIFSGCTSNNATSLDNNHIWTFVKVYSGNSSETIHFTITENQWKIIWKITKIPDKYIEGIRVPASSPFLNIFVYGLDSNGIITGGVTAFSNDNRYSGTQMVNDGPSSYELRILVMDLQEWSVTISQ